MKNNSPSREIILRCVEKDNEFINTINNKIVSLIDSLSSINNFRIFDKLFSYTGIIESLSKFIFYYCSYMNMNMKNDLTPGEEYTNIRKNFGSSKKSIFLYILIISIRNILIKKIQFMIGSYIESNLNRNTLIQNNKMNFYRVLRDRILLKITQDLLSFDDLVEKLEEIQFCYFFINGSYFNFLQRLFGFEYIYSLNHNKQSGEIINNNGFKFFGYLMGIKLVFELWSKVKNLYKVYKTEKQKLKKENINYGDLNTNDSIVPEVNKKILNIKSTNSNNSNRHTITTDATCLLCLDVRKNTSVTLCGHLFCWSCIINYLQTNTSCPFCRKECQPQNVILLQNYN
jgi:peroxin-10